MAVETKPVKEILAGMSKEEAHDDGRDEFGAILKDLPKEKINFLSGVYLYLYQGFWVPEKAFRSVVCAQKNFVARDDDIILTSCPKSGTTWLKTLTFSVVHRTRFALKDSPLLNTHAHDTVPYIETLSLYNSEASPHDSQPRILSTHIPYESLPPSVKTSSSSKIVYISRNPMDQFVSDWHFLAKYKGDENGKPDHLEDYFDDFSRGIHAFGPFWDHVLGFWKASLERPEKILFLKYEDLKKDPLVNIKKLAGFLGFPFSKEEEEKGVIDEILTFCSIGRMKNLEINKFGNHWNGIPRSAFFRKGEVGGSKEFLTPSMVEFMEKLMQEKYGDHYLALKFSI